MTIQKAFDTVAETFIVNKFSTLNIPIHVLAWLTDYIFVLKKAIRFTQWQVFKLSGYHMRSPTGFCSEPAYHNDDSWFLRGDISRISAWCDTWNMKRNITTCHRVRFTRKR